MRQFVDSFKMISLLSYKIRIPSLHKFPGVRLVFGYIWCCLSADSPLISLFLRLKHIKVYSFLFVVFLLRNSLKQLQTILVISCKISFLIKCELSCHPSCMHKSHPLSLLNRFHRSNISIGIFFWFIFASRAVCLSRSRVLQTHLILGNLSTGTIPTKATHRVIVEYGWQLSSAKRSC